MSGRIDRPRPSRKRSLRERGTVHAAPPDPVRLNVRERWRALTPARQAMLAAGLVASLTALLLHAWRHLFLTDDAFISFRYAQNLAHGHGLVFNPGFEAVEGYSNFLYVIVLAAFAALGIPPDLMAHVLSMAATVALWAMMAVFALQRLGSRSRTWVALVPLLLLAATRSIAVWSSSGLETRWFEALAVGGLLRLVVEVEADVEGRSRRTIATWLFALASLTRPDGLLVCLATFGAATFFRAWRRSLDARRFAFDVLPGIALIGGHLLWRHAYYGDWLPNTYYVKVDGRMWWGMGLQYVTAFALEYAAYLWVPLLALAVLRHRRRGTVTVPLLAAAFVVPHLLYVVAIGGDHFEYRPLDLYLPPIFLLMGDGLAEWLERRSWWTVAPVAYAVVVLVGLWELPALSHAQFPDRYLFGFPGSDRVVRERRDFLDPQRSRLYRLPGLAAIAAAHRDRLRTITHHFSGLRQEEHRLFLASVMPDALALRQAVDRGLVPRDMYLAIPCIGAIPYYSDLRILDWLGLTDTRIAHLPYARKQTLAHDKVGTVDYGRERGVDLWVPSPNPVCALTSPALTNAIRNAIRDARTAGGSERLWAADLGDGRFLIGYLLGGPAAAARRMPRLAFEPLDDGAVALRLVGAAIAAVRDSLRRTPADRALEAQLAHLLLLHGEVPAADSLYRELASATPDDAEVWEKLAGCRFRLGDVRGCAAALDHVLELAEANEDSVRLSRILHNVYGFGFDPSQALWPQIRRDLAELARRRGETPAAPGGWH